MASGPEPGRPDGRPAVDDGKRSFRDDGIRSLQLVTTPRPFFEQQVQVLERNGVSCTVVRVPRPDEGTRSVVEYARFYVDVLRRVVRSDFDVVHANYGLTAPFALAQPTRPAILTLWGSDVFGRYGRVSTACARRFDAVVVMSGEMAERVDDAAHVIPHGVDTELFSPRDPEAAKAAVGWDPTVEHVLFPYDPSRAVKNYPRARSVVARVAAEFETPVRLHAVHGVPHERVPVYMNAADALLLTSAHEGSPNAVKEALACNLPVVAVDVGDVGELLDGVRNCRTCRSDAELVEALTAVLDSGSRSDGRSRIDAYSLERMAEDLLGVYESVLEPGADGERVPSTARH